MEKHCPIFQLIPSYGLSRDVKWKWTLALSGSLIVQQKCLIHCYVWFLACICLQLFWFSCLNLMKNFLCFILKVVSREVIGSILQPACRTVCQFKTIPFIHTVVYLLLFSVRSDCTVTLYSHSVNSRRSYSFACQSEWVLHSKVGKRGRS